MKRGFAIAWLIIVLLAGAHVGQQVARGLPLQTDILSLLPSEEQDPIVQHAKNRITRELMQRIVFLISHEDGATARRAAAVIEQGLRSKALLLPQSDVPSIAVMKEVGAAYYPYRSGLLSPLDRDALKAGRSDEIVTRALSQVYGFAGAVDGRLMARDPFLLFPSFLNFLPVPMSKLKFEDGFLAANEGGKTHILLTGTLAGESTSLSFQETLVEELNRLIAENSQVAVLRLGAVFFAHASAQSAMAEAATLSVVSLAATFILLLFAFRSVRPILLGFLAIGVGIVCALSLCLLWFGEIHVAAQLFGASLIGVAVDYSLIYFGQAFGLSQEGHSRLRRVLPGLFLGMLTTVIGYATLALSPFPGLHQVALFSCAGLVASFLAVVLWFPYFDRLESLSLPKAVRGCGNRLWQFWSMKKFFWARICVFAAILLVCISGFLCISTDDDIRNQQALNADLLKQQNELMQIAGFSHSNQFFLIQGADTESVLRLEERLAENLFGEMAAGNLSNFVSPARFVPSIERQAENRQLMATHLSGERLQNYIEQIGLEVLMNEEKGSYLQIEPVLELGAFRLVPKLVLAGPKGEVVHLVTLEGVRNPARLRAIAAENPGVRLIDPTADYTVLFALYRQRALVLIFVSAAFMFPALAWRYGWGGALRVLAPPLLALVATPALLALFGQPFTFFSAMALVLILSMGVDYAVFCAEDSGARDPAVLIAVALAMSTAFLSFGLLAMSATAAVKSFGLTMAIGLPFAYLLSPMGGEARIVKRLESGGAST